MEEVSQIFSDIQIFRQLNIRECIPYLRCRIEMVKEVFMEKKKLFTSKTNTEQKKLIIMCLVWSVVLYSTEIWTMTQTYSRRSEAFEVWIWRRVKRSAGLIKLLIMRKFSEE